LHFRDDLRTIYCGDPDRKSKHHIDITDKAIERLVKACPNLEHIRFSNCAQVKEPLRYILKHCSKIQSIVITAKKRSKAALGLQFGRGPGPFDDLYKNKYGLDLKYMEFHGLTFNIDRKNFFRPLTMSRVMLDIVIGPIEPPIVALFSMGHETILESESLILGKALEDKAMMRHLIRTSRDPERERYGAYDDVDEEFGDMFGSDSDDGFDEGLGFDDFAARGYYDNDYNPYDENGDVDIDFLRTHGY
jgi:hypothetical protein